MPGLGRYPCTSCHYIANNRRMLARHAALIHCDKVFKCPVCPFITRYAANWYRHKRDQHGLSKLTTCDKCGFFASNTTELAQHRELEHPEVLQLDKFEDKYAKEKVRLTEGTENLPQNIPSSLPGGSLEPDVLLDIYDIESELNNLNVSDNGNSLNESVQFSLPLNGHFGSDLTTAENPVAAPPSQEDSPDSANMNDVDQSSDLGPLRIRRRYSCYQCGLLTNNPREFLYHLRNVHGEKIAIHECKYCIYASKHIQKLQRHCNLVHRQILEKDPEYKRVLETSKDKKNRLEAEMGMTASHPVTQNVQNSNVVMPNKPPLRNKPQATLLKCSMCTYQTRNKALMFHHEKTVHVKKKTFRCNQCNYTTTEKSRYTKHIKYHNLPRLQCDYCFFKTPYKWNMDRHMKNHEEGAEGDYRCSECNFTTSTKQSYNAHVANHHDPLAENMDDPEFEMNGNSASNEWEDIDVETMEDGIFGNNDDQLDSYEFTESSENPESNWNKSKTYSKNLKCQYCDFRAAWPFELRKHEENHRSQKKHPCPLCGMRFEHIAWLTKHLRRIHGDNSQAKSIANTFDMLKPARRRPGKEYACDAVLPMFQEVLKQNNSTESKSPDPEKGSMLSSLLKKPLQPYSSQSASKFSSSYRTKYAPTSNMLRQPRISNYYNKVPTQESQDSMNMKKVPTCNVCGYKTRWISELQRHMRVHSQDKPFQCHKCRYVCKWKGDLNRHLMKYHGIKMLPYGKKNGMPKIKLKKTDNEFEENENENEWQTSEQEKRNMFPMLTRSSEESPLDLTLAREAFPHPNSLMQPFENYNFNSMSRGMESENISMDGSPSLMYPSSSQSSPASMDESSNQKRKYQCPSCSFSTTTASRFHVHIVQHYNKRPFMCSVCGYNSNWEWDITKHIRIKGCRDKSHNKACVLLTDETGRRNYEKYEKYLVDINQPKPADFPTKLPEIDNIPDNGAQFNSPRPNFNDNTNKNCSYDFRSIGSNFDDAPVNIVVTPDINFPDPPDEPEEFLCEEEAEMLESGIAESELGDNGEPNNYYCKHCNFRHNSKRVVISHLSFHAGVKPYRCRTCHISSNWRYVIVKHVKEVHNGYMNEVEERVSFVQEGLGFRLATPGSEEISNVEQETTSQETFGCKICPYKCDKEFYMKFHMKQHRPREGAVYRCDYCPYFVKFKKTVVKHMKLHQPDAANGSCNENSNNISENQPQSYSNDVYDFYENQRNEPEDSIAISFNQLSQANPPDVSPQKIKRHVCEHCPYRTDNKTQYLYHKQFHRPNPSAPFKCNSCTYWATMQHLLTQHMRVHSDSTDDQQENTSPKKGPRQFFEFFDDKNAPDKISIVYVKRGEDTVKMFKCEYCPMMNKKKANVRVHQKMHGVVINDGKYACSYCNYQCLNQGGLTNHMKVHQKGDECETMSNNSFDRESSPKKLYDFEYDEDLVPPIKRKTSSYFCFKCPAIFKTANDLQNHKKFHGSDLPLKCTYCDYRVKHKPHITQHLTVHTAEYKAKRRASHPLNVVPSKVPRMEDLSGNKDIVPPKKIDQMLLLEVSEIKIALKKSGESANTLQRCSLCPAAFIKNSILAYHVSLHGSDGDYRCSYCDYAVSRLDNLDLHLKLHPKKLKSPVKRTLKSFACPKCPAVFYKLDRYERHLNLHGQGYRFACDQCDYSVRFAANLIKHKKVHLINKEPVVAESLEGTDQLIETLSSTVRPLGDSTNIIEEEKKIIYICDRCPYSQNRKDAVQSHHRRHWLEDGYNCPYCDYSSMQNSFLQSHIKLHIQPNNLFPPQAFMKFTSFKVYVKDGEKEELLFDDEDMEDSESDDDLNEQKESGGMKNMEEDTNQTEPEESSDFAFGNEKGHSSRDYSGDGKNMRNQMKHEYNSKEMKNNYASEKDDSAVDDVKRASSAKGIRNDYCPSEINDSMTDSNFSSSSSKSSKVPIVVLSDIFGNDNNLKQWGNKFKIPKLKISTKYADYPNSEKSFKKFKAADSVSEESNNSNKHKKSSKPSLVVKIKCLVNKEEKTMYSVSTKTSDELPKKETSIDSSENTNDSSDMVFPDPNPSLKTISCISPVEDIEENTLTSNPCVDDSSKAVDNCIDNSVVEPDSSELILSQPSDEVADSTDSFSNDTVPAVSEMLCNKLNALEELSFKDSDLSLTNGECTNHLASTGLGHLTEEIKVGL